MQPNKQRWNHRESDKRNMKDERIYGKNHKWPYLKISSSTPSPLSQTSMKSSLHLQKGKRMTPENPSVSELVSSLRALSKIFSVILPSCPSNFQKALQNLSQSSMETSPSTKSSLSKLSRNWPHSHQKQLFCFPPESFLPQKPKQKLHHPKRSLPSL